MEVMITATAPAPAEFNFHSSSCTTTPKYISAPSSPQRFNAFFFSAPTSPTQASAFYKEFNNNRHVSAIPFDWEVKPGIPKSNHNVTTDDDEEVEEEEEDCRDFAFDFSGHLDSSTCSLTADELFDDGKIKPLKPPPRLQFYDLPLQQQRKSDYYYSYTTPKSPRSPKRIIKDALSVSPRRRNNNNQDFDPFVAAHDHITCRQSRTTTNSSSSSKHKKKSRSLSPFRASDLLFDSNQEKNTKRSNSSFNWYKKWKLKDLLLFRSASEGRATTTNKEQMKKYAVLKKTQLQDDVKNSSFRSTDSVGSVASGSSSSRRRGAAVSAHELHYKASRAISEEMRKKTYLPYKQSLLGCLGFRNSGKPIIHH